MDIVGDRKFVEVPGEKTHELPPLLVRTTPNVRRLDRVVGMANNLIDAEDMMAPPAFDGSRVTVKDSSGVTGLEGRN